MQFDAVIAGAGPAGCYLAYLLAKTGLSVALVDKSAFPREKVCGGGLSRKTVDLLEFDIGPVAHKRITGAYLTFKNQQTIVKDLDGLGGYTVTRSEFDQFLLQKAQQAGASFFPKTSVADVIVHADYVTLKTTGVTLKGSVLFGADGVGSTIRKRIFGSDLVTYSPAMEALVYTSPPQMEKFHNRLLLDLGGMHRGYGWIFPKADHLNVGVYSIFGARNIRRSLDEFIQRYELLRNYSHICHLGYAIPVRNKQKKFESGRVWLLGDAAGLAESVYGEGIYFALKSATVAAEALGSADYRPNTDHYTRLLTEMLVPELHYSELLGRSYFSFPTFNFNRMVKNTLINRYFSGLITGDTSYKECFYKTALTVPYWLFTKKHVKTIPIEF